MILVTLAAGEVVGLGLFSKKAASSLDSVGLLIFLALAWLGTYVGAYFFDNFIRTPEEAHFTVFSGGTMPLSNIGLGLKVASALFLVFSVLAALQVIQRKIEDAPTAEDDA